MMSANARHRPWYSELYIQVLLGIAAGVVLGWLAPHTGAALRPLGDAFLKMIKMVIGLVIFCTVVSGIGGMNDLKKVGRVGVKALLYFEILSTLALLLGALAADLVHPGAGFDVDPTHLDTAAVATYVGRAPATDAVSFLVGIIPDTVIDAFAKGDILPIVFISVLFGYALSRVGEAGKPVATLVAATGRMVFSAINLLMRFAPLGAFGAMAYTIGRFGIGSLRPLAGLVLTFVALSVFFICIILGAVCRWTGVRILQLLRFLKEELLVTLGAASSDVALPSLMQKLEKLGCSKSVVGLVVPTGYVFNADGTSLYMTLAALFVAQAMNIHLSWLQQAAIFGVSMVTSKGASGISGAGFIALVGTLSVVPSIPLAGMALILGIDRLMSAVRAIVNIVGNAVATVVMASLENELDRDRMHAVLNRSMESPVTPDAQQTTEPTQLRKATPMTRVSLATASIAAVLLFSSAASRVLAAAPATPDTSAAPLHLLHKIPLPTIDGDFDHFGVDVEGNRLFLAAEEHHTVELFNLDTGKPLASIGGFDTPHSMTLLLDRNEIYIIDGGQGGAARVINATTYKVEKSIPLTEDADAMAYDATRHLLYVANGGKEAHNDYSLISVIDTVKGERVQDFRVSSANLESIALEKGGPLLYVNARDKDQIVQIDRTTAPSRPRGPCSPSNTTPRCSWMSSTTACSWRAASRAASASSTAIPARRS